MHKVKSIPNAQLNHPPRALQVHHGFLFICVCRCYEAIVEAIGSQCDDFNCGLTVI